MAAEIESLPENLVTGLDDGFEAFFSTDLDGGADFLTDCSGSFFRFGGPSIILQLPSKFDMSFSNPIELHTVALSHPQVRFVIPHFGAGYFREVLMLGDLVPNVYLDTSSSNSWIKYHTPPIGLSTIFRQALNVYGTERLLFGSDSSFFPRGWNAEIFHAQSAALKELNIGTEDARAVFGENLRRLLSGK